SWNLGPPQTYESVRAFISLRVRVFGCPHLATTDCDSTGKSRTEHRERQRLRDVRNRFKECRIQRARPLKPNSESKVEWIVSRESVLIEGDEEQACHVRVEFENGWVKRTFRCGPSVLVSVLQFPTCHTP